MTHSSKSGRETRLAEARANYLSELERDKQEKAIEAKRNELKAKVKNLNLSRIYLVKKTIREFEYKSVGTSMEYTEKWGDLNQLRDTLDDVKDHIYHPENYFPFNEREGKRKEILQLQNQVDELHTKLAKHAKRENLELLV